MGIYFNVKDFKSFTLVNEAFYGKNKKLLAIEKQIGIARRPYLGKRLASGNFYGDKEIDKVGKMLADYFEFEYVDFNLMNDVNLNACTMTLGRGMFTGSITYADRIKQTQEGLKAGSSMKGLCLYTRITTGLWGNINFTDAEVLAIILHEIGHNFQHVRNSAIGMYDLILSSVMWAQLLYGNFIGVAYDTNVRASIGKNLKQNPFWSSVVSAFSSLKGLISSIASSAEALMVLMAPFAKIYSAAITVVNSLTTDPLSWFSFVNKGAEYLSDDFANKLGYGAELGNALTKMTSDKSATTVTHVVYNLPIFKELNDIMTILANAVFSPISSHPVAGKRIKNMIVELEKDLKQSDLSPALRKEIRAQIDQLNKCADSMINMPDSSTILQKNMQSQMNKKIDPFSKMILNYTTESTEDDSDDMVMEEFFEY